MLAGDVDLGLAMDAEAEATGQMTASQVAAVSQVSAVRPGTTAAETAPAIRLESIRPTSPDALDRTSDHPAIDVLADDLPQEPSDKKRKTGPMAPSTDDASSSNKPPSDNEGGMIAVRTPELPSDHADELASMDFTTDLEIHFLTVDYAGSDAQRTPAQSPATLRTSGLSQSAVTASTPLTQTASTQVEHPVQPLAENPVQPLVQNPVRPLAETPAASVSDGGGMIRVYSTALPTLGPTALSSQIRIQLDPSMGHYRNFRIAETPGLDSEHDSKRSGTLVSRWTQGDPVERNRFKRKSAGVRGLSRPVATTPSVVSGSALLSGEIAGRGEAVNAARSQ
ncbi:hypothetical protein Enr13x_47800 [Stieleria neptunia]|uniref:Uncharacterized protein n=2 Tax=Stieleria neptunia TaxID=2527979 RepID=A0A518HVP1_9BACT|nr:hypothetical protein Enr13x_47800 [Stieleria neptunia]